MTNTEAQTVVSVRGKAVSLPSMQIHGRATIITGKWLKVASVHDEFWLEGAVVDDPEHFIAKLKEHGQADIFRFAQRLPDVTPRYLYKVEWDNAAAVPITTYKEWLEKRVEYDVRKAIKKAARLGLVVREAEFNDEFVRGIVDIYNESPMRQGGPFTHYQKDFETVKRENATYRERADFIGAYSDGELIGFIKMVYVDKLACTMQVISKIKDRDKKPTNALLAKAVEVCERKRVSHLIYGKFVYGNKSNSPLTEFKRRNGFEEMRIPTYYVPLTAKGRLAVALRLHLGLLGMLPPKVIDLLINYRNRYYEKKFAGKTA